MQLDESQWKEVQSRIKEFHEKRNLERDFMTILNDKGWVTVDLFNFKDRYEIHVSFRSGFRCERCALSKFKKYWPWNCQLEHTIEDDMFKFFEFSIDKFNKLMQRDVFDLRKITKCFEPFAFGLYEFGNLFLFVSHEFDNGKSKTSLSILENRNVLIEDFVGNIKNGLKEMIKQLSVDSYLKLPCELRDLV